MYHEHLAGGCETLKIPEPVHPGMSYIGLGAFVYGKNSLLPKAIVLGIALMVYPYFVSDVWMIYGIWGDGSVFAGSGDGCRGRDGLPIRPTGWGLPALGIAATPLWRVPG